MRRVLLLTIAVFVAAGCGEAEERPAQRPPDPNAVPLRPMRLIDVDETRAAALRAATRNLDDPRIAQIVRAELDYDEMDAGPGRPWLILTVARGRNELDTARALWVGELVLADVFVRAEQAGAPIAGGEVRYEGEVGINDRPGFLPGPDDPMYTNQWGQRVQPRRDRDRGKAEIRAAAEARGYRIDSLEFVEVRGVAPMLEVTARDPVASVRAGAYDGLFGDDIAQWDGVFLIVRNERGELVKGGYYASGTQTGAGFVAPAYAEYDSSMHASGPSMPGDSTLSGGPSEPRP